LPSDLYKEYSVFSKNNNTNPSSFYIRNSTHSNDIRLVVCKSPSFYYNKPNMPDILDIPDIPNIPDKLTNYITDL
jgi:hypothetical protein